jgi:cardiolipin synthase A/B
MMKTNWQIYTNVNDAWDAMLTACQEAQTSIDLEQFIFLNDEIGSKFLEVCRAKAEEGVKVRLLCDAAGSFSFFASSFLKSLKSPNFEVAFFNSFIPGTLRNHTIWFFRDHRKLLVVDDKVGFTGGACVTSEVKNWRDTHVKISGEVVAEMKYSFNVLWEKARKRKYRPAPPPKTAEGFNYVLNNPRPRQRYLYYRLIDAIRTAKRYIYLTTPYFVPDRRFRRALRLASRRGVDVRLLLPEKTDHPIVDLGGQSYFYKLLEDGVRIYRYKNKMLHAKAAIIDDVWSTVGSLNFDNISFLYNFEANLVSMDANFAHELKKHYLHDIGESHEIDLGEWKSRPLSQKILAFLIKPLRKIL